MSVFCETIKKKELYWSLSKDTGRWSLENSVSKGELTYDYPLNIALSCLCYFWCVMDPLGKKENPVPSGGYLNWAKVMRMQGDTVAGLLETRM